MNTTTIRVDQDTHRRFVAISRASNRPLVEVLRDAAESLERARFAAEVSAQLDALRERPDEWANYTMDADLSLRDGLS